jgi:hypothetical protein
MGGTAPVGHRIEVLATEGITMAARTNLQTMRIWVVPNNAGRRG